MPKNKDLKRLVRTRMKKTGESYTSARTQITRTPKTRAAALPEQDYARLAGMSDEAVRNRTGRTWEQWVASLDAVDAVSMPHRDIARHLHRGHELTAWWAQTVTVGYERIRKLREVGQRRGGGYEANKSKTFAVPLSELYRAFSSPAVRNRWLPGIEFKIRTATPDRSMRVTWPDGTDLQLQFAAKGGAKSRVTVQHGKLAAKEAADHLKAYWADRLGVLESLLREV